MITIRPTRQQNTDTKRGNANALTTFSRSERPPTSTWNTRERSTHMLLRRSRTAIASGRRLITCRSIDGCIHQREVSPFRSLCGDRWTMACSLRVRRWKAAKKRKELMHGGCKCTTTLQCCTLQISKMCDDPVSFRSCFSLLDSDLRGQW